ncbi:CDP-diacylglycerol--glycerol-3-phosphate 3-phosphatidyltransferase, mitochondrial-like [Stegodyphus dumicola]|uniref:CDP-diacylglycerol--glycerol-3-phosphate 3-phosphatidyltransferase, mitochondrial-like n=1 Tax=Stegodyphus dumicola TaxID=202533 RepID=UPI0015AD2785|nr:CDP-diacylglycerol--glycerol-3-phosphate 3-phosphatidyltransferase, mitochondrial-like [Stegodyphus dumicola]
MRPQVCLLNLQTKIWSTFSAFVASNFQIPISVVPNSNAKKLALNMKESEQSLAWLADHSPEFAVSSKHIQVLKEPSEFFEKLKELSKSSRKRITLASLYIGTGPLEKELVSSIEEGLEKSEGTLKVQILIDYTRGSRGKENTRTLLIPLLKNYPSQVQVSLYHTPNLRGFIKWFLPERWNETIGLSHLKVYLFDDTLILSGANLSDQYFCNRQDRYIVFHDCKDLCDYFNELVSIVSSMSFILRSDNTVALHSDWDIHPSEGNFKEFVTKAHNYLKKFILPTKPNAWHNSVKNCTFDSEKKDTFIYPLLQMYTFGIRQDEQAVEKFLRFAEPHSCIKLASGYFNLTNHYMNVILKSSSALYSLLVASPKVCLYIFTLL